MNQADIRMHALVGEIGMHIYSFVHSEHQYVYVGIVQMHDDDE